jgi:hypothetical protein
MPGKSRSLSDDVRSEVMIDSRYDEASLFKYECILDVDAL